MTHQFRLVVTPEAAPAAASGVRQGWQRPGVLALLGILWLATAGITGCRHQSPDTLARARQEGVIRIGYAIEPPYAFLTPDGQVTGEAPEIARVVARQLGIGRVEWQLTEFDNLIQNLDSGQYDVIAAGMFITPERSQIVSFSRPTCQVAPGLLVQLHNPKQLHSYADLLTHQTLRIAALSGSVEEKQLLRLGFPSDRLASTPNAFVGMELVNSGKADGLVLSAPTIRWLAAKEHLKNVEFASPFKQGGDSTNNLTGQAAFAFRLEDQSLRDAWNLALKAYLGSAEHLKMVEAFGFTAAELPDLETNESQ